MHSPRTVFFSAAIPALLTDYPAHLVLTTPPAARQHRNPRLTNTVHLPAANFCPIVPPDKLLRPAGVYLIDSPGAGMDALLARRGAAMRGYWAS